MFHLLLYLSGDPPDNASRFLRVFRRHKENNWLSPTRICVLGLGDTNYENFCAPAKRLEKEVRDKGAHIWIPLGTADDGIGLAIGVEPWRENLMKHIKQEMGMDNQHTTATIAPSSSDASLSHDQLSAEKKEAHAAPTPTPSTTTALPSSLSSTSSSSSLLYPALILYGSQTGNAEEIAKAIHQQWLHTLPLPSSSSSSLLRVQSMSDYISTHNNNIDELINEYIILFVISTTGEGDLPDNANRFFRLLKQKKEKKWFSHTHIGILGLGDSNYSNFNAAAKKLEKELTNKGAFFLFPTGLADDGVGLALVVEPWREELFRQLKKLMEQGQTTHISAPVLTTKAEVMEEKKQEPSPTPHVPAEITPSVAPVMPSVAPPPPPPVAEPSIPSPSAVRVEPVQPKVKVEKPKLLARLPVIRTHVQYITPSPVSDVDKEKKKDINTYFSQRWKNIDTETSLKGYTSESPFFATLISAKYLTTSTSHSHQSGYGRKVVHMELEIPAGIDGVIYNPGDCVAIYGCNDEKMIDHIINRLELDPFAGIQIVSDEQASGEGSKENKESKADVSETSTTPDASDPSSSPAPSSSSSPPPSSSSSSSSPPPISVLSHIQTPCTVRDALLFCCDVTSVPRKTFLRLLAEWCWDPTDKLTLYRLASPIGKEEYEKLLVNQHASLLDILQLFPSCKPSLSVLLDQLPPLQPRSYSIACSPSYYPTTMHIAWTKVEFNTQKFGYKQGVATCWLEKLGKAAGFLKEDGNITNVSPPSLSPSSSPSSSSSSSSPVFLPGVISDHLGRLRVAVFIRRSRDFGLPSDISKPIIMVGPGTGVAPFRGFIMHRACQKQAIKAGGTGLGMWRGLEVVEAKRQISDGPTHIENETHTLSTPAPPTSNSAPSLISSHSLSSSSHIQSSPSIVSRGLMRNCAPRGHYYDEDALIDREIEGENDSIHAQVGPLYLYFGCQRADLDYLYADEWAQFIYKGYLQEMHVAFSRETPADMIAPPSQKQYVQRRLHEHASDIYDILFKQNGYFFVCGDGARMAKDVMATLTLIVQEKGGLTPQVAAQKVFQLMKDKRYIQDIWS